MTLDLKSAGGQEAVHRMLADAADVSGGELPPRHLAGPALRLQVS
ncbi:hypothetical protein [Streptomyces sp. KL116D]